MKLKFLLSLLFVVLLQQLSFAQLKQPTVKDLNTIKERPLLVVLQEEDPDRIKKLKKYPKSIAAYKKAVVDYNEYMQKNAAQVWNISTSVVFKTESEFKDIQKKKSKEYAYIKYDLKPMKKTSSAHDMATKPYTYDQETWETPTLHLGLTEQPAHGFIFVQPLPAFNPTEGELAISLRMMQATLNATEQVADKKVNKKDVLAQQVAKLQTKTLLLDKAQLVKGLTEASVKAAYALPFEITDAKTIEQRILEGKGNFAVVNIAPILGMQYLMHQVVDIETGESFTYSAPGAMGSKAKPQTAHMVSKESLSEYLKDYKAN